MMACRRNGIKPAAEAQLDPLVSVSFVPAPNGMSDGFYAFMGEQLMMLARSLGIPSRLMTGESNYSAAWSMDQQSPEAERGEDDEDR